MARLFALHFRERFAFATPTRLQEAAYARVPSGRANAATDSVSGRVWAAMTSCASYNALLHALPPVQMRCYRMSVPRYSEGNRMLPPQILPASSIPDYDIERSPLFAKISFSFFLATNIKITPINPCRK